MPDDFNARLQQALLNAFPTDHSLNTFLIGHFNKPLAHIASNGTPYPDQLMDVIFYMKGKQQIALLMRKALEAQPQNQFLVDMHAEFVLSAGAPSGNHNDACVFFGSNYFVNRRNLRQHLLDLVSDNKRVIFIHGHRQSGKSYSAGYIAHFLKVHPKVRCVVYNLKDFRSKPLPEVIEHITAKLGWTYAGHHTRGDDAAFWLRGRIASELGDDEKLWMVFDNCDETTLVPTVANLLDTLACEALTLPRLRMILIDRQEPLPLEAQLIGAEDSIPMPTVQDVERFLIDLAALKDQPFDDVATAQAEAELIMSVIDPNEPLYPQLNQALKAWVETNL